MSSAADRAFLFYNKAQKKLKGVLFFRPSEAALDDAAEMFEKSANLFKSVKQWQKAGESYLRVAECQRKLGTIPYVVKAMTNAGHMFKKVDSDKAVECYNGAVAAAMEEGRLFQAGKLQKEIAELYEKERDIETAIKFYADAAETFGDEERAASDERNCLLKVAEFSAARGDYDKSAGIYESVALKCVPNRLLVWSAREYFSRCLLCILARGDTVKADMKLTLFERSDATFPRTPEHKLCQRLITAMNDRDEGEFTNALREYDSMKPLDTWRTNLLEVIKTHIEEEEEEEEEDDVC
ncbi:NSF attachment protein like protein [Aduncisulcus paluster]|uniref:NSF attachment protein like protein n=1 Tax=Aduncisulcus paluster TaxID=2918883 RepID=A0ABQ5K4N8_9EUKA|nr:NSF attachment protein like protein [Aduncisulcus paluster]